MAFNLSTRPTDHQLESAVSRVLLFGVLLSALIVLTGAVFYLSQNYAAHPDYTHFHATASHTIAATFSAALHGSPQGLMQTGLLVLIATPIARVILCLGGFVLQRDRLYVFISAVVLAVLLFSLIYSHA